MKSIDVVGAVIVERGRILCAQRGPGGPLGGMWEFPGGKIEPGESPEQALAREIDEELQCSVTVGPRVTTTRHQYSFAIINLSTYWCDLEHGEPATTEHASLQWLRPTELDRLEWAPADIPAVHLIAQEMS
ncbi:(deoxy)nucleoside triphosphate pyrophosphohydrolase [Janibacter indicus]|uniref:(deoxy)nucleoside triphosphate pyrophosphohydrolase n=1 Tax=Janibacter indicus TaxID=857417 RepID=UPI003EBDC320